MSLTDAASPWLPPYYSQVHLGGGSPVEHIYHGRQEDEMEEQIGALFHPLKTYSP